MEQIKTIAFVGAGNLAWHLAPVLENAGHIIKYVYSQNSKNARTLVNRLYNAEVKEDLDFSDSNCDLIIIAVKDEAIEGVATELIIGENTRVVHTSGTQPMSLLGYLATEQIGVFYPLQTFSKSRNVEFEKIPICVEAQTPGLHEELMVMGKAISRKVWYVDTNDRKVLHLAAVFSCNFTNHLFLLAKELLERRGMDFEILHPLIIETVQKAIEIGPENAQTGPAIRRDNEVIDFQKSYLSFDEGMAELYQKLTDSILEHLPNPEKENL